MTQDTDEERPSVRHGGRGTGPPGPLQDSPVVSCPKALRTLSFGWFWRLHCIGGLKHSVNTVRDRDWTRRTLLLDGVGKPSESWILEQSLLQAGAGTLLRWAYDPLPDTGTQRISLWPVALRCGKLEYIFTF